MFQHIHIPLQLYQIPHLHQTVQPPTLQVHLQDQQKQVLLLQSHFQHQQLVQLLLMKAIYHQDIHGQWITIQYQRAVQPPASHFQIALVE